MQLAPGTVVGDRYVVEGPLGQGGMAVVYRVRHRSLGTAHALKLVGLTSASARARLLREGRLQGQLVHPNVVTVTDQLEVGGVPAIVLELVDGPPLSQLLGHPLSIDQIDALGAGILSGVAAAHAIGLVHRDLKPANVLVAVENGRAVPKVTDFGLAVDPSSEDRATRTGAALGTPEYMAPEQVRSAKDVDARADVWALGVLLYELATGTPPFLDEDRFTLFQRITAGDFVPLTARRPDLPGRMTDTVAAALQVDRERRPRDAAELLRAWSAEVRDARIDDLAQRILDLAPSRSSGSGAELAPEVEPAATWMPPPATYAEPPRRQVSLPPPPPPAVVPPPTLGLPGPYALLGALVATAVAISLVTSLTAVGARWLIERPAPGPVPIVPEVVNWQPTVAVERGDAGLEDLREPQLAEPTAARDAFRDARWARVYRDGHFFLATHPDASWLVATAYEGQDRPYSAREEMTKAARRAPAGTLPEGVVAWFAGDPEPLRKLAHDHPEDAAVVVWQVWASCPGDGCAGVDLGPVEEAWPTRGVVPYLQQLQLRALGRYDAAEQALDAWGRLAPDEPQLRIERARLRLAQGRYADATALLEEPGGDRAGAALALRAIAAERTHDAVRFETAQNEAHRAAVNEQYAFARWTAEDLLAQGREDEAIALLDQIRDRLYVNDDNCAALAVEVWMLRLELAARRHDRATAESIASKIQALDKPSAQGWVKLYFSRVGLVAEGLRMVSRGDEAAARKRLAGVEAVAPEFPPLVHLRHALDGR